MTKERRIAVIGGGASGLAAAWRLEQAGVRAVVYEQSSNVGGLLDTASLGGVKLDTAVQLLSSTYTRLFELATECGVRALLVRASGRDAMWRKGTAQEITYGNVPSMVTSGALPTLLKLRLGAKYLPFLTMQAGALDANDPASSGGGAFDMESIATWGAREVGEDFVEYLAYPLLAAYYGSPPEATSASFYHALARVGMDVEVYAVHGGMSALAAGIERALVTRGAVVRTGVAVSAVAQQDDAWIVAADGVTESFDAVIVATPPHVAHALLAAVPAAHALRAWLGQMDTRPAATIGVVLEGGMRAQYFGVSFPRVDSPGDRVVALALQQNKPAGLTPPGMSAVVVFPSPDAVARIATMNAADAMAFIAPSLESVYPGIMARVRASEVYAGDARYRSLAPGFVRRIQELRNVSMPKGLAVAGDYTMAPTVEGAVRSGERAAAAVLMTG